MVGGENNDGFFGQTGFFQRANHSPEAFIHAVNHGGIDGAVLPHFGGAIFRGIISTAP